MADAVIEVSHISKSYGSTVGLRDVSFCVEKGQVVALLGPNGAGKTTLLEIIEGLRRPDSGEVRILGARVSNNQHWGGRSVGVMLQENRLPLKLTVAEILRLFRSLRPNAMPLKEIVDRFQLSRILSRKTEHLSGGERQRVAVAIAVMHRPSVLILDEPTNALDPISRQAFWEELLRIKREGCSVLLATHQIEEAEAISDRVVMLNRASLIADATVRDLIEGTCPGFRVTCRAKKVDSLGSGDIGLVGPDWQSTASGLCGNAADLGQGLARAAEAWATAGARIDSVEVARPSLREVFFVLSGEEYRR